MKKSNKLVTGFVTLASVVTLAACSSTNDSTKVVTMKGDTITVTDFYKEAKTSTAAQQSMLSLIMSRVFEQEYGKKVSDKKVEESYNKTAQQYGSSFSEALGRAGLTTETYKKQIRTTMLVEYAVKQEAKKELTEANYKKAFESYSPEMTTQVIIMDDEAKAKKVLEEVKAEGADFSKIAKENTVESGKKIDFTFDSAGTDLPSDVISAAGKLNEGAKSELLTVMDPSTYQKKYYIVNMVKKADKKADWKEYKKRLTEIIMKSKENDTAFQNKVISKSLDKANVKIKDKAFANILSQFASNKGKGGIPSTVGKK
ncbi:peptidylprolyl isomerase PrsA [Streptococcus pseudoporcinus]|uniref:Foldase protein PrsA n=1 Tax=Streptococcus pseudoporcinus TaxID=361101 RepID=A0A4U9XI23_9STRE|nr:peptidylprolyl isomerase PrsA [Streptococcus pseudoporcinus]VTS12803.1 foldase protein PrsA 1 [Streptococcus pseudoporcinus]VUC65674.1 foldase protein PrsA 1 [Streptococcus pseudoporcinus]VUC96595.1 foldase protein PrsA 1 [Streptococcus pseudoporcinus]VUC96987.1 foldase protein PrsA 1 [Streptococcus pseudoporcinus]